jgi:purine-binding chemotaxis protein CheW
MISPDEKKRILKARALALAHKPATPTVEPSLEVVEFSLAAEQYGIETVFVREVFPFKDLTPVPCTPPFIAGIINVRGRMLPVADLKKFFDLSDKGPGQPHKVLILHNDGMELGILTDNVAGVHSVPQGQLQASLPTLTGIRERYLRGVTSDGLVVLDAGKLLSDESLIVNEEVA